MPFIPNVPGVPALSSFAPPNLFELLITDAASLLISALFPNTWGVFLDDLPIPIISYESFVSFEYKQDLPISTYPVEQGAFLSYDKVRLPAEIKIRLAQGGSVFDRQKFLFSLDAAMTTTGLYTVVTPEEVFLSYNFVHRDLVRTADQGVGLIVVDIWLMEVMQTATAFFQSVATPAVAGQVGGGSLTPQPAPAGVPSPE